jgi:hypothetical protein
MPNSRASAAFEPPSATRCRNSAARTGVSDGFLPLYFPSRLAIAIASRWRSRINSRSNSAYRPMYRAFWNTALRTQISGPAYGFEKKKYLAIRCGRYSTQARFRQKVCFGSG